MEKEKNKKNESQTKVITVQKRKPTQDELVAQKKVEDTQLKKIDENISLNVGWAITHDCNCFKLRLCATDRLITAISSEA